MSDLPSKNPKTSGFPQKSIRLHHGEDAVSVMLHVDDVGMCHGANVAFLNLFRSGAVTSGSVMVPCPWFAEIAAEARRDSSLDLGVHLTLTSEWAHYRWRPLSTASRSSGLVDDDGFLPRRVHELSERLVPEAAEIEMRAQINRAIDSGIRVTHLDTHMGTAMLPRLLPIYLALGQSYGLPIMLPSKGRFSQTNSVIYREAVRELHRRGLLIFDTFRTTQEVSAEFTLDAYRKMIAALPSGRTFVALHCNTPGDIETIAPDEAHWRVNEYKLLKSGVVQEWLRELGFSSFGFKPIQQVWRNRTGYRGV